MSAGAKGARASRANRANSSKPSRPSPVRESPSKTVRSRPSWSLVKMRASS